MDAEIYRCIYMMAGAILVSMPFALIASWVHKEYHRRHAEGRAPRWLYRLECLRATLGRDKAEGRPDPPEPNE